MSISYSFPKLTTINFTVKNISKSKKTIKIFGQKIAYGKTYDLLSIPYVDESDIRNSLVKGDLANRVRTGDIEIVSSSINLVQFDAEQQQFITDAFAEDAVVVGVSSSGGGGNIVVWAPYAEPLPPNAYRTWAEAVQAINDLDTPFTTLQIVANPNTDIVFIPSGTWTLKGTTIVGPNPQILGVLGSDPFIGSLTRNLCVVRESNPDDPCRLYGVVGLKDLYFATSTFALGPLSPTYIPGPVPVPVPVSNIQVATDVEIPFELGSLVDVTVTSTNGIRPNELIRLGEPPLIPFPMGGGPIMVETAFGYFRVVDVNTSTSTITIRSLGFGLGGMLYQNTYLYPDDSIFYVTDGYGTDNNFILDNTSLLSDNYLFGLLHVDKYGPDGYYEGDFSGRLSLKLTNSSRIIGFGDSGVIFVNGYLVIDTDGSTCAVFPYTLFTTNIFKDAEPEPVTSTDLLGGPVGPPIGFADIILGSNSAVSPTFSDWFNQYMPVQYWQTNYFYQPTDLYNWDGYNVVDVKQALDLLASRGIK